MGYLPGRQSIDSLDCILVSTSARFLILILAGISFAAVRA